MTQALPDCKLRSEWQALLPICDSYRIALAALVQRQGYPNRQLRDQVFSLHLSMFPAMSMGGLHKEAIAILKQDVATWCALHVKMPAEETGFLSLLEEVRATVFRAGARLMSEGKQWQRSGRDYLAIHLDIAERLPETFDAEEFALEWMTGSPYPESAPAFRLLIALREANVRSSEDDPKCRLALEDALSKCGSKLYDAGFHAPALEMYERAHALCLAGFARWPESLEWWVDLLLSHIFLAQTYNAMQQGAQALRYCKVAMKLLDARPPATTTPEQERGGDEVALTAIMQMRNSGEEMRIKRDLIHSWMLVGDRAGAREIVEVELIRWEAELNRAS